MLIIHDIVFGRQYACPMEKGQVWPSLKRLKNRLHGTLLLQPMMGSGGGGVTDREKAWLILRIGEPGFDINFHIQTNSTHTRLAHRTVRTHRERRAGVRAWIRVARRLMLKKAKLCLKKGQILEFTKLTFGKKAQTLNKPRLENKANYLINSQKFRGQLFKERPNLSFWPQKGKLGNPGLNTALAQQSLKISWFNKKFLAFQPSCIQISIYIYIYTIAI